MNPAMPMAEAILVDSDRIKHVYNKDPASVPAASIVDLGGGVVVPGLHDAHVHLDSMANSEHMLDLSDTRTATEVVALVQARINDKRESFIVGRGWDQTRWNCSKSSPPCGGAMPSRTLLDAASSTAPVLLWRVDGHAAWINSALLERAIKSGATALKRGGADPSGGRILRDSRGESTGVLIDGAMELVSKHIPKPGPEELREYLKLAVARAARTGLTAVHDMGTDRPTLDALTSLERSRELPLRVFVYVDGAAPDWPTLLPQGGPLKAPGRVEVRGVKLFADGALGSRGAALLQPYADEPSSSGLLVTEPQTLMKQIRAVHAAGFQVAVHAIGDAANRSVLGMLSDLGDSGKARRHRNEHAQVVNPQDFKAFQAGGVVASMQPTHATSDMRWAEFRLGKERLRGAYAWRSLLNLGAVLAFGSDAPIESEKPLWGIYAARTRMNHEGEPGGGWQAHECVNGDEALAGFTTGAAYAVHRETELGVLKEGALADFTWLSQDPRTVKPSALLSVQVLGTVVGGQRSWNKTPSQRSAP
jgi:predicted amidohydrolase YtcJ